MTSSNLFIAYFKILKFSLIILWWQKYDTILIILTFHKKLNLSTKFCQCRAYVIIVDEQLILTFFILILRLI